MIELHYTRHGELSDVVRLRVKGMTNHELRTLILGLWVVLDAHDRADMISELQHYAIDPSGLPALARAIRDAIDGLRDFPP